MLPPGWLPTQRHGYRATIEHCTCSHALCECTSGSRMHYPHRCVERELTEAVLEGFSVSMVEESSVTTACARMRQMEPLRPASPAKRQSLKSRSRRVTLYRGRNAAQGGEGTTSAQRSPCMSPCLTVTADPAIVQCSCLLSAGHRSGLEATGRSKALKFSKVGHQLCMTLPTIASVRMIFITMYTRGSRQRAPAALAVS